MVKTQKATLKSNSRFENFKIKFDVLKGAYFVIILFMWIALWLQHFFLSMINDNKAFT